jgi:hypothetical protein
MELYDCPYSDIQNSPGLINRWLRRCELASNGGDSGTSPQDDGNAIPGDYNLEFWTAVVRITEKVTEISLWKMRVFLYEKIKVIF